MGVLDTDDEDGYITSLRCKAEGALEIIRRDQTPGWKKDWWNGYSQALDDVQAHRDATARTVADQQNDLVRRQLDALEQQCSENIMRGHMNTVQIREWISQTRSLLPRD